MNFDQSDSDNNVTPKLSSQQHSELRQINIGNGVFKVINSLLIVLGVIHIIAWDTRQFMLAAVLIFGGQIANSMLVLKKESLIRMMHQGYE